MVSRRVLSSGNRSAHSRREEDEMIWWPPAPAVELARLAVDSGGDPAAIHLALDPTGMDIAISKLNCGGWVHIFPEGSHSRDGGRTVGSVKRGIGRLVLDTDNVPVILPPFVHTAMQEIMPIGAKFPRSGKTVGASKVDTRMNCMM